MLKISMRIFKWQIIVCILFLSNFNAYGQNMQIYPKIIGLREFNLPKLSSRTWYELNYSNDVYFIDNNGNVSIVKERMVGMYRLETDNGTIIGTNRGEWGGELIYKNDTLEYTILNENICGIINYNNEIYVLTGLSHLGISKGRIVKLELINDKWRSTFSWEFNSSPEIYTVYNNKLYIVTFDGLIIFDGNNIQQLISNEFWSSLYPQSIYVNDEIIVIGMRGCLAIINKFNNEIKCYKK
jgi:hypothetical protein